MDRLLFISLFLGLVSGRQWVEMRAAPEVKAIRITLGGHEVAFLHQPPWQTAINIDSLEPGELVATGFNDRNQEIAHTSQWLNLPHPVAELQVVFHPDTNSVSLVWQHREHAQPNKAKISFDGKALRVTKDYTAKLPAMDPEQPHVISAELRFKDGSEARTDHVVHGGFSDTAETELTAIALKNTTAKPAASLDGCLAVEGRAVETRIPETSDALLVIVKDPDPREVRQKRNDIGPMIRSEMPLDPTTTVLFVWPVSSDIAVQGEPKTKLFAFSGHAAGSPGGVPWLLAQNPPKKLRSMKRQYADAVAVAGLKAMRSSRRRAVILLLSQNTDGSDYKPADVRHYLASIGAPLFVWSLDGARPDLGDQWGTIEDISTREKLTSAYEQVRHALDEQRIVWVATDPLHALHVAARNECGVEPLAHGATQ
ncbi:MAG TPA: hypothetical protein VJ901_11430 [Thermoanaerobaculia bacterium]|nr:hypothetical protein [Thermoanaerobaculia bacterium]